MGPTTKIARRGTRSASVPPHSMLISTSRSGFAEPITPALATDPVAYKTTESG